MKYFIVKKFLSGILEGLTYEEITDVRWKVGDKVLHPVCNTSPYEIIQVTPLFPVKKK